jgi:hypothetical protein
MKNINLRVLLSALCMAAVLAGGVSRADAGPVKFDQIVQILTAHPGKGQTSLFSRIAIAGSQTAVVTDDDEDDAKKKKSEPVPQDDRVITETRTEIVDDGPCFCEEDEERRGFPKWALLGLAAIPFLFITTKSPTPTPTRTPPGGSINATAATCEPATGNVTRIQFIGQLLGLTFLIDGLPVVPDAAGFVTVPPGPHTWAVLQNGVVVASGDIFVPPCNSTPTPTPTPTPTVTPTPTPTITPTPTKTPPTTVTPTPPEPVPEPMTILLFGTGLASVGLAARRRFGKKRREDEKDDE